MGKRLPCCSEQEVKVIGHERPGIDNHSSVLTETGQTTKKIICIHLALENLSSINAPAHNIWNTPGASRTPFRFRQDQNMVLAFSLIIYIPWDRFL
jgi:hypothetical protein